MSTPTQGPGSARPDAQDQSRPASQNRSRPASQRRSRPASPSIASSSLMVAEREITTQIRSKSFIISTVVMLVIVLAGIVLGSLFGDRLGSDTKVATVPATAALLEGVEGIEVVPAGDEAAARAMVDAEEVAGALLPDAQSDTNPLGVLVVGKESAPDSVLNALAITPPVELLAEASTSEALRYVIALLFGLVFLFSTMTFGSTIAQNTVTEKQTRVVEILLSAVPARALLAGKVLGNTVLAVGQTAAIAAAAVIGLVVTGQDDLLGQLGAPVAWFVIFFLLGFLLLAAMFASAASLVSRMEDTGAVLTPVMWLVMIPYFLVIFFNDNDAVLAVMSYVPFSAPVGMPMRLFLGTAAWWEPLLSLVILALSAWGVTTVGARIYARSVLRTGRRVKLREALASRD